MEPADLTLSAGPNDVYPEVRAAMGGPILYHYDPVFKDRFRAAEEQVGRIFRTTSHEIILMQGEAILGLEAAARSLCTRGTPVLNLVSGVFGKGFGYWLTAIGAELHELEVAYDDAIDPDAVAAYLDAHPQIKVLSVVHSETPSGTLNAVDRLGPICRSRGVVSIVDVVSSFGGIELRSEDWQLDLLVAGPQKCLGGPPGMSLMAVSPQAWAAIEANPDAPRGSYLSMLDYRTLWHGEGRFPFTPSVPDLHGVLAATGLLLAEGLEAVQARHDRVARAAWAGVCAMGLRPWPRSQGIAASSVTSITSRGPPGHPGPRPRAVAVAWGAALRGPRAGNIIRIGHMGNTARPMWMVAGLTAVGRTMIDLGARVGSGPASRPPWRPLAEPVPSSGAA
ncbi:MAG: aminotransferase class V-fold PLP-dependent enzyme [Chloroflexota bacterium]